MSEVNKENFFRVDAEERIKFFAPTLELNFNVVALIDNVNFIC